MTPGGRCDPADWRSGSRPSSGFISPSRWPREKSTKRWKRPAWRTASASARSSGRRGGVLRSAWGLRMRKEAGAAAPAVRGWQSHVLDDVNRRLLASLWTRETLLRGSMARGSADSESDIDLVAVTADAEFETALRDLTSELPQFLPGRLPPWLDGI